MSHFPLLKMGLLNQFIPIPSYVKHKEYFNCTWLPLFEGSLTEGFCEVTNLAFRTHILSTGVPTLFFLNFYWEG